MRGLPLPAAASTSKRGPRRIDELVEASAQAHIDADHPDLVGKYSREDILSMAHEH